MGTGTLGLGQGYWDIGGHGKWDRGTWTRKPGQGDWDIDGGTGMSGINWRTGALGLELE